MVQFIDLHIWNHNWEKNHLIKVDGSASHGGTSSTETPFSMITQAYAKLTQNQPVQQICKWYSMKQRI